MYPEGVPCWIDVQLPDVEAGKRFYGELFGWTFKVAPGDGAHEVWAYLPATPAAPAGGPPLSGAAEDGARAPGTTPSGPEEPGTTPSGSKPGIRESGAPEPGTREPGTRESGTRESGTRESGAEEPGVEGSGATGRAPGSGAIRPGAPSGAALAPVAALAPKPDGRMPTVWTPHFATPDVVALTARIRAAGGQVITTPTPVGELGITALATDPEGAVFGLWQAGTHPGFGRRHEPGTFAWAELYTRDTKAANAFYAHLFHDALFGPGADPDFGRAAVTEVFPAEMPPHFLVHFGTEDCEAALGAVTRLGGRVQVPPFDTSYGNVAVVTDNQGASFALLERWAGGDWREAPRETGREEQLPDDLRLQGDEEREDEG